MGKQLQQAFHKRYDKGENPRKSIQHHEGKRNHSHGEMSFHSAQSLSPVRLFVTPLISARQASLSIANSLSWLKLMSIESVMPSNHLIFCCLLLLRCSIFPNIRIFSNESVLRISSKVLELQHQSFQWVSGLISFRMDLVWSPCSPRDSQEFPLAPQFKSINSLKLSLLYSPALTSVCDYWKNYSFDSTDIIGKVMSLLFNMLSRFTIAFFQRAIVF